MPDAVASRKRQLSGSAIDSSAAAAFRSPHPILYKTRMMWGVATASRTWRAGFIRRAVGVRFKPRKTRVSEPSGQLARAVITIAATTSPPRSAAAGLGKSRRMIPVSSGSES